MKSSFAPPENRMALPLAAASFTSFFAFVPTTPFFWIGHTLLTTLESTVIYTISCASSTEFTSLSSNYSWIVELVFSAVRRRHAHTLPALACVPFRDHSEFITLSYAIFTEPVTLTLTTLTDTASLFSLNFNESVSLLFTNFTAPVALLCSGLGRSTRTRLCGLRLNQVVLRFFRRSASSSSTPATPHRHSDNLFPMSSARQTAMQWGMLADNEG